MSRATVPTGWQFSPLACTAREVTARLIGPLFGFLMRGPAVRGREHLAELDGPALICPTHASHLDFVALRLALGPAPRHRLAGAAAADYFTVEPLRWFVASWLGSFAFDRAGRGGRDSIAAAVGLLAAGWHVLVFPEGTRSTTGVIGRFKPGAALIALEAGVPILPVRIHGTADVLPKGSSRPRRAQVSVAFGTPLRPLPGEEARALTERLEAAVRALEA